MYESLKLDGWQADTFICSLKFHYNKQVKCLGQTGAGLTVEVLQGVTQEIFVNEVQSRTDLSKGGAHEEMQRP